MNDPIAIVGVGCRYPGGVDDPESFWQLLIEGGDAIREIDRDGIDLERLFDPTPRTPGHMMTRWGGFLDDLERFDAAFFGISPREAGSLDPVQRLLLEATWEACEDATIDPHTLSGEPVGVFVGQWLSDFEGRLFADVEQVDFHSTTGSGRYASSGRLSFVFGAMGPSITIDTACSSSLVAVHLACQSLRSGESTTAIAAGVNVILQPHISIAYSQSGMMAPDGRCKFGDANGDGYVRSEGVGVVLLKPLEAALADGDPIRAVIRGSAVNNDGRGSGHMATPSRTGQAAMLRAAYVNAGVAPQHVGYVEAHGTGTRAGDPVEIGALADVLAAERPAGSRCLVGSVKTNIGHTEGAAGMAGLIKCVLALEHAEVPGSLHLREPNPAIPWDTMPFAIPQQRVPWPAGNGTRRIAGVSAFGITGTNAHVVVEQAPSAASEALPTADDGRALPLVLSAASPTALQALAGAYADLLAAAGGPARRDVCATAARHRAGLEHRAMMVSADRDDLVERLRRFAAGDQQAADVAASAPVVAPRRIAFAFPGQGGQWQGMARELLATEPAFGAVIDACDAALPPDVRWTVRAQLEAEPDDAAYRLGEIGVIQPTLLAVEIALAATWRAWGVEPDAVVGHSMGEVGAAYVAGALTLADAMRIICARSELLQRTSGAGAMALLDRTIEEATALIAPYDGRVVVAVSNGPRSTVISGDPDAIAAVLTACEADGIFGRAVKVDVASHSAQMDPLVPDLVDGLHDLTPQPSATRLYSTVDAAARPGETWDAHYWGRNMRQPVLFGQTVERMLADGIDAVVEMSPHPTLLPSLAQAAGATARPPLAIGSLRRGEPERATMLAALGSLWSVGHPVDWAVQFPTGSYARVPLPLYPWQRERHWSDAAEPVAADGNQRRRAMLDDVAKGWLHTLRWDSVPLPDPAPVAAGRWLVVGDASEDLAAVRGALEAVGGSVDTADSVEEASRRAAGSDLGIVFLPFEGASAFDTIAALQAIQAAWPAADQDSPPLLWWVTHGVHVGDGDAPTDDTVEQAAVWGAARVIAVEHPDWWGGLIDLDPAESLAAQADSLARQLTSGDSEDQTAIRSGARLALRLVPATAPIGRSTHLWRSDAAYLVTGGLGGVAEHIAMSMVRDGARRLILLGRSGLPPRIEWAGISPGTELARRIAAVRALEHAGAAVHLMQADVADEARMRTALDAYAAEGWPPIAGVVHAAGVLDNHLTSALDQASFDTVVGPKLAGARVLDRLLPDLDVFVLFSSMMAFWPPAGMANYAAANAGLDALARVRRGRGQHALSIEWGPWASVGLLERAEERNVEAFAYQGIDAFTAEQGVACFAALMTQDEPVVAVLPIDWARFRSAHSGRDYALFRSAPMADDGGGTLDSMVTRLEGASSTERLTLLRNLVRDTVGAVLRLPAAQLDAERPFGSLGLDSLMALELRNRLETALERSLSATLAWNYPTVEALAAHLDSLLVVSADETVSTPGETAPSTVDVFELIDDVASLSDDDALRALRGAR